MLLLLDLDGTLIDDRAYRAAIDATVQRYAEQHGLPVYLPTDADVAVLHAHGFSNEWDSVAFLVGILYDARARQLQERPSYQAWTRKTAQYQGLPNERARDALLREAPAALHATLYALLDHVTDVEHTPTTRLFAETILGSDLFTQHYGLPPALNTPSLLEALDEPLLQPAGHDIIVTHRSCIFTARPSLPPGHRFANGSGNSEALIPPVHPPEAEIGLKLLRLEHLPMIALGHVQWLADQHRERVYDLTKPGPVQALAAMLAACGIEEQQALRAAYRLWKHGVYDPLYQGLHNQHVYVFEDNAGGVRACHTAASLLGTQGIQVTIHGMGIAVAEAKRMALLPVCDAVYPSVNEALADVSVASAKPAAQG
jgi:phosphoglycolate phosphatase-like HAD superfamily hydrolase